MRQKAVDAVFGGGELRVVKIVGVNGNTVGKSGEARRRLDGGADDAGFSGALGYTEILKVFAERGGPFRTRNQPEPSRNHRAWIFCRGRERWPGCLRIWC